MVSLKRCYDVLRRKKIISADDLTTTNLAKCLTTLDLTAMGIGSTLGVGVYVLAGEVSKYSAGPAIVISFAIAAVVSVLSGLCYAEFGARVPKAGSAYIYSFVTIGEFVGFLIGWNLILEYAIGAASVVKGLSTYVDALADYKISGFFLQHVPINITGFSSYADFFAFGVIILFTFALAFGVKESVMVNNVFTITNLSVVLFVIISSFWLIDIANWQIPAEQVPAGFGEGGFMPYGFNGVVKGAAICFYGFIGFDVIATAGEEAKNPRKSIPIAVCVSLFVIFLAYFGISSVLTMMLPYYLQDENSPLPSVFKYFGWTLTAKIISYGAIFGLMASLMGSMFPLPRVIYAMASDGLIYKIMGRINERFHTPMYGTFIAGTITATLSTFFNLSQLVSMMSIGTLLAYSIVALCVLILRFEVDPDVDQDEFGKVVISRQSVMQRLSSRKWRLEEPDQLSSGIATVLITVYVCLCIIFGIAMKFILSDIGAGKVYAIIFLVVLAVLLIIPLGLLSLQPTSKIELPFRVPFGFWLPSISMLVNIYLMMELDVMTWVRFAVWIIIGLLIYFTYGIRHSSVRQRHLMTTKGNQKL